MRIANIACKNRIEADKFFPVFQSLHDKKNTKKVEIKKVTLPLINSQWTGNFNAYSTLIVVLLSVTVLQLTRLLQDF